MRGMTFEFNYTTLDPSVAVQIQEAIENNQPFALAGRRSISIFSPSTLRSAYFSKRHYSDMQQSYNSPSDMATAISLALLGQKTFIPASQLLSYCSENKFLGAIKLLSI